MSKTDKILNLYFIGYTSGYIATKLETNVENVKRAIAHARNADKRRATAMHRSTRYELAEKLYEALKARGNENGTLEEQDFWRSQTLTKRGR